MQSYSIRLRSDSPIRLSRALHEALIPTIGPRVGEFVPTDDGMWKINEEITVLVNARDRVAAIDRVTSVVAGVEILGTPAKVGGRPDPRHVPRVPIRARDEAP